MLYHSLPVSGNAMVSFDFFLVSSLKEIQGFKTEIEKKLVNFAFFERLLDNSPWAYGE